MPKRVEINEIHYKKCSHCHEILPLSNFYYCDGTVDKLGYICKSCSATISRENHKRDREERPFFLMWRRMIEICHTAENWDKGEQLEKSWNLYGGRGIKVSEEFMNYDIFEAYISDLKEKAQVLYGPEVDLWIDRIDVNGHYERGNIRFVSAFESAMNKRECQIDEYEHVVPNGMGKLPLTWWCRIYQIELGTVINRMKKGWSLARALNEKVEVKFRKNQVKQVIEITEDIRCVEGVYFFDGHPLTFKALCDKYNQKPSTIVARIKRGKSIKDALSILN